MTSEKAADMAAIATMLNPLAPENEPELLTFWNNSLGDLAMVQRSDYLKNKDISSYTSMEKQIGILKNPSSIVALKYKNTISVYGIAQPLTNPVTTAVVKRLSPIVEPLDAPSGTLNIEGPASLAGCTDPSGKQGWLYLIKKEKSPHDEEEIDDVVAEYTIGSRDPPLTLPTSSPLPKSYLAAAYLPREGGEGTRLVFFQGRSGGITALNFAIDEDKLIPGTKSLAKYPTPIAACAAKDPKDSKIYVYVYFVDSKYGICRSIYGKSGKDAEPVALSAKYMTSWSQLSVAVGATANLVTYVSDEKTKSLTVFADER